MKTDLPLVSIVIPVFNGSNYISQAIESALSQTYPSIEVLVINDGSTDDGRTREMVKKYGDRIRYFEKENGGVATALNVGIIEMKGAFFSWLSHDDVYYPYKIEKQIDFYLKLGKSNIVVFSHEDIIDSTGNLLHKSERFVQRKEPLAYTLLYHRFISACSLLIPKSAFDVAGIFDPRLKTVQDYDIFFRIMAAGYSFEYCPITSGMARTHGEQDSNRKKDLHVLEKDKFFQELLIKIPKEIWLDSIKNEVWAVLKLKEKFRNQGLLKASGYCETWIRREISEESWIKKSLGVIEYYFLNGFYNLRWLLVKFYKKIRIF